MISKLALVLITNRHICKRPLIDTVTLAIKGGVGAIQLREKDLSANKLFSLASDLKDITDNLGAQLIINDRVDVMMATGAHGVHIGKDSIPVKEVRKIIGDDRLIGYSAHGVQEAQRAWRDGADYVSISPIFATRSKGNGVDQKPVGTEAIRKLKMSTACFVVALGGIDESNVDGVLSNGADGVAVMSSILAATDPFTAAKMLKGRTAGNGQL